jgi:hypothetical protein
LSDGKYSLHPAVTLFTDGTLGALSPQHAEAQDSFRVVVVGNHHPLKKLKLQRYIPNKHLSIRGYIQPELPTFNQELRKFKCLNQPGY